MKVVINGCFGGFGLNHEALTLYNSLVETPVKWASDIERNDPVLVQVVESMDANGPYSDLKVVEIPDGIDWFVDEYDGNEMIREAHRTWE